MNLFQTPLVFGLLVSILLPAVSHARDAGHVVIKHGSVDDDLYLAGGQVDLYASVDGDVVVAGGQLHLEGDIKADLIAAGGKIDLRGSVADDARIAGGDIRVSSRIGDDLVAAAGRIHLSPVSRTGGRAWLSAGEVRVDGEVADALRASGGRIVISGTVNGNVELWADEIIIEPTAVIAGDLQYKSAREARIASDARIDGTVLRTPVDIPVKPLIAGVIFAMFAVLLSLIVTGIVLYLLFPEFSLRVSRSLGDEPWLSLAWGLAALAGVPVLVIILFSTAVGVWLALMMLAAYLVMLLVGYLVGALFVGNTGLNMLGKTDAGKALRVTALSIALLILAVFNLVPLLGSLVNWAVLLTGMGALTRQLYLSHRT